MDLKSFFFTTHFTHLSLFIFSIFPQNNFNNKIILHVKPLIFFYYYYDYFIICTIAKTSKTIQELTDKAKTHIFISKNTKYFYVLL